MPDDKSPMTLVDAARLRADTEQQVLGFLTQLVERTGMDLRGVTVHTIARMNPDTDQPQVYPMAVRIDLTV